MLVEQLTKSELVFQNYCQQRGYALSRIRPTSNSGRFPDFCLETPAGEVIAEIKELTPNEKDRLFLKELKQIGRASYSRAIGKRVRDAIRDAAPQLRRYRNLKTPKVLILYDNIIIDGIRPWEHNDYLGPFDIAAGRFGSPVIRFWPDLEVKPADANDSAHGGGRQCTEADRLYISAVAVLNDATETNPAQIDFFHNWFTAKALNPRYFTHPGDRHYVKIAHPDISGWDWSEFIGDRQTA